MMRDFEELVDARRQRRPQSGRQPNPQALPSLPVSDPDRRDRRMLALHRGDRRSIAQIAANEGLTEREVRQGIDRALQIEGSSLPDFAWEQAAPSWRWALDPLP